MERYQYVREDKQLNVTIDLYGIFDSYDLDFFNEMKYHKRIAFCYDEDTAKLIVDALNFAE